MRPRPTAWSARAAWLALLMVASQAPAHAAGIHVRVQPATLTVSPGQEFDVELYVFQADASFNAFDAVIRFDPTRLTYVAPANSATQQGALMTAACANRFHLFAATADSLVTNLSLLCANVTVTGPGVIYHVRFRAGSQPGPTAISLGPSTRFYRAGFFVDPLEKQPMQVCVDLCTTTDAPAPSREPLGLLPPSPNPWPVGRAANFGFTTAIPGAVRLDLFDPAGRRIAGRGPEWCAAGRHDWTLTSVPFSTGVCFARLITPDGTSSRTLVRLR